MDTVALVATAAYSYAGHSMAVGEVFQASPKDADLLKLVGRAVDAPAGLSVLTPNNDRKLNPKIIQGGDVPMLTQQHYSLVESEPMAVRMRALVGFERSPTLTGDRTQELHPGDEFDAHDVESVALAHYRKAELVSDEPAVEQPRKKRRYRRRDLRAEP